MNTIANWLRRKRMNGLLALVAALLPWLAAARTTAADKPIAWLTGDKLQAQLEQKIGVDWGGKKGLALRPALASLSRSQHVAILLDRRIDPDRKIELSAHDVSLQALLELIADKKQMGLGQVGTVIYLGPKATAEKIRTLAALRREEALHLPAGPRSHILQLRPVHWSELSTPRDLIAALAAECHVEIHGAERIPHDLWAAADLPRANFIDRLTLIAAQFDLTFRFAADGQSVQLVKIPAAVAIEHTYPLVGGLAPRHREIAAKLSAALPGAKIEATSDGLVVRGRAEDQAFVERFLSGRPAKRTTVTSGRKVYQLVIVMPVGPLIKTLGKKMGLEVKIDDEAIKAAGLSLATEVKVSVKDASADELLTAVLKPAGLTFVRHGERIEVKPAGK